MMSVAGGFRGNKQKNLLSSQTALLLALVLFLIAIDEVHSWSGWSGGKYGTKSSGCPFTAKPKTAVEESEPEVETTDSSDPLLDINNYFLNAYTNTLSQLVNNTLQTSLVMLMTNDSLITYHKGQRTVDGPLTPDLFTSLKTVVHIAFGAFTILDPIAQINNGILDEEARESLSQFLELVYTAYPTFPQRFPNVTMLERQYMIANMSIAFMNQVLQSNRATYSLLVSFARALMPYIDLNIWDAATARLNLLHSFVMAKQKTIDEDTWNRLIVVLSGSHMPRTRYAELQYFSRLLNTPQTAELKVIYAEALFAEEDLLSLLGDHIDGWQTGVAFFNDMTRMHSDVLSIAAQEYLPFILPTSPCCYPPSANEEKESATTEEVIETILL